jgi:hypothetical protein
MFLNVPSCPSISLVIVLRIYKNTKYHSIILRDIFYNNFDTVENKENLVVSSRFELACIFAFFRPRSTHDFAIEPTRTESKVRPPNKRYLVTDNISCTLIG